MSNVRNFYVITEVDGRATRDASGPRSKDGGFTARIDMRCEGSIMRALEIRGWVPVEGRLRLEVWSGDNLVHSIEVQR